jgi:uncharacterized protein YndB with AHSA1/START domain
MARLEGRATIDRPPAEVFALVADAENNPKWHATCTRRAGSTTGRRAWVEAGGRSVGCLGGNGSSSVSINDLGQIAIRIKPPMTFSSSFGRIRSTS